jgi:hypothetical protein
MKTLGHAFDADGKKNGAAKKSKALVASSN